MAMTIYLLHFERRISPRHTTQHYLGIAKDLEARLADHASGQGARLTQVAVERGISWTVVRTWKGDRTFERRLKNRKHANYLCPLCGRARSKTHKQKEKHAA